MSNAEVNLIRGHGVKGLVRALSIIILDPLL